MHFLDGSDLYYSRNGVEEWHAEKTMVDTITRQLRNFTSREGQKFGTKIESEQNDVTRDERRRKDIQCIC